MKRKMKLLKNCYWILPVLAVLGIVSCKKENSSGFTAGTGAPSITSVHTLNKTTLDTSTTSVTTYNSSGVATTTSGTSITNKVTAFDSTTNTGNLGNLYIVYGTNLGSTTKITVNGVQVYFNRGLITDKSIVITIPTNVPYVQPQPNTIVLTSLHGSVTYKFTVLPPPPTILSMSTNDFQSGTTITLAGKGFASVTSVKIRSTGDAATIAAQTDTTMTLTMPQSTAKQSQLLFTYTSGSNNGAQAASTQVFNDLDNADYQVFTDNFGPNVYGTSWGTNGTSNTISKTGSTSFWVNYPKGNWWIGGWGFNVPLANDYKTMTLWIKGGVQDETLYLISAAGNGGFGNSDQTVALTLPANVWTYFTLNIAQTDMFLNGSTTSNVGFYFRGPNNSDETIYYDDVVFWK